MPELVVPHLRPRPVRERVGRTCAAHRSWVKRHYCSVRDCRRMPIQCAHVRSGTNGGMGLKPSDRWAISLCEYHHREQHQIGEWAFEEKHSLDLRELAKEFCEPIALSG